MTAGAPVSARADTPSVRYRVTHRTSYGYDEPVTWGTNVARLLPRDTSAQRVLDATLRIDPAPEVLAERVDFYGNRVHYLSLEQPFPGLEVVARSTVAVAGPPAPDPTAAARPWDEVTALLRSPTQPDATTAAEFALGSPLAAPHAPLTEYAASSFPAGRPLLEAAADLAHRVHRDFAYLPGSTTVATPLAEVVERRRGVCQDFAHVFLAGLRGLGLAARYVSGYVETEPRGGTAALVGADASHAWCSVWLPGHGWIDVDPTNDQLVGDRHVTVAWGRDYADVPPLKGVIFFEGERQTLDVAVRVERADAPA